MIRIARFIRQLKLSILFFVQNEVYDYLSPLPKPTVVIRLSFRIRKNTFVVLDNASVHRCKLMRELRPVWEKRGLFLFFLPPYSPHLNIAETLWRILKGKWLRPVDYCSTDSLLYATNRALAALDTELNINFVFKKMNKMSCIIRDV
ncbi:MAG: transposase [Parabacteroides sp.]|nr:transposase [Parabacteroides sp.]